MEASIRLSKTWLSVAAQAHESAIPSVPQMSALHGGKDGVARNVPTNAVKVMRAAIFGFVSAR